MMARPTIYQIFRFIEISSIITSTWPNDPNKGKLTFILRQIEWMFTVFNITTAEISFMCIVFYKWDNVTTKMKILSQFFVGMEMLLNLIIFKLKSTDIQVF